MKPADEILLDFRVFWLLDERRRSWPSDSTFRIPNRDDFASGDGLDGYRNIATFLPQELRHLAIIHAIEMVTRQDQHILRARGLDLEQLLADGICRALIPVRPFGSLLGGQDVHPAGMEHVKVIRLGNVPVERNGIELGQDRHAVDPRVDAVADRDINETVLPRDRHGRLGAHLRQWVQAGSFTSSHNHTQDIVH